jgi:hypothetical protein
MTKKYDDFTEFNAENAFIFEHMLRMSLNKLEEFRILNNGSLGRIVCVNNVSNYICGLLDKLIMQEDPSYVPKKPMAAPVNFFLWDALTPSKLGRLYSKKDKLKAKYIATTQFPHSNPDSLSGANPKDNIKEKQSLNYSLDPISGYFIVDLFGARIGINYGRLENSLIFKSANDDDCDPFCIKEFKTFRNTHKDQRMKRNSGFWKIFKKKKKRQNVEDGVLVSINSQLDSTEFAKFQPTTLTFNTCPTIVNTNSIAINSTSPASNSSKTIESSNTEVDNTIEVPFGEKNSVQIPSNPSQPERLIAPKSDSCKYLLSNDAEKDSLQSHLNYNVNRLGKLKRGKLINDRILKFEKNSGSSNGIHSSIADEELISSVYYKKSKSVNERVALEDSPPIDHPQDQNKLKVVRMVERRFDDAKKVESVNQNIEIEYMEKAHQINDIVNKYLDSLSPTMTTPKSRLMDSNYSIEHLRLIRNKMKTCNSADAEKMGSFEHSGVELLRFIRSKNEFQGSPLSIVNEPTISHKKSPNLSVGSFSKKASNSIISELVLDGPQRTTKNRSTQPSQHSNNIAISNKQSQSSREERPMFRKLKMTNIEVNQHIATQIVDAGSIGKINSAYTDFTSSSNPDNLDPIGKNFPSAYSKSRFKVNVENSMNQMSLNEKRKLRQLKLSDNLAMNNTFIKESNIKHTSTQDGYPNDNPVASNVKRPLFSGKRMIAHTSDQTINTGSDSTDILVPKRKESSKHDHK